MSKGWRTAGCYVWRTRKPGAPLGLPIIGRHFGYVGETGSRYHRDRQHIHGGGRYGAVAKPWADLAPRCYPLPCLFPRWKWGRKIQEWFWIKLLLPVYNDKHNRSNPRRIKLGRQEAQRWARDAAAKRRWVRWPVDFRVMIGRLIFWAAVLITVAMAIGRAG